MTARCRSCGRELRDPESIAAGLGPVCRRALRHRPGVAGGDQLALLDIPPEPPPRRRRRTPRRWPARHRGRRVRTLPDIANYQTQETTR